MGKKRNGLPPRRRGRRPRRLPRGGTARAPALPRRPRRALPDAQRRRDVPRGDRDHPPAPGLGLPAPRGRGRLGRHLPADPEGEGPRRRGDQPAAAGGRDARADRPAGRPAARHGRARGRRRRAPHRLGRGRRPAGAVGARGDQARAAAPARGRARRHPGRGVARVRRPGRLRDGVPLGGRAAPAQPAPASLDEARATLARLARRNESLQLRLAETERRRRCSGAASPPEPGSGARVGVSAAARRRRRRCAR